MTWNDTATCETCGMSGFLEHPTTGQEIMQEYNDKMLCSVCRVDQRLEDGYYRDE